MMSHGKERQQDTRILLPSWIITSWGSVIRLLINELHPFFNFPPPPRSGALLLTLSFLFVHRACLGGWVP